ncbi:hypothetical protein V6N12_056512 [Hibiscus sabdariffa]|uniref:UspA domain-containing protein n=1 Tax=Hibiscus sabdariffa TaxID=183260 RepID=A0ABR2CSQ2_9ROSI
MGRTGPRLPSFCLNRIRPHVRVRSPPVQAKANLNCAAPATATATDDPNKHGVCGKVEGEKPGFLLGRKIMIVVDSTVESKGALQWALSHTVQCHDTIVLLYVTKPSKQATDTNGESDKNKASRGGGGGERERSNNSGGGQEARGGASGSGAKVEVRDMAAHHDVGEQPDNRRRRGVLHPERRLHGSCGEEKKQEARRKFGLCLYRWPWRLSDYGAKGNTVGSPVVPLSDATVS